MKEKEPLSLFTSRAGEILFQIQWETRSVCLGASPPGTEEVVVVGGPSECEVGRKDLRRARS